MRILLEISAGLSTIRPLVNLSMVEGFHALVIRIHVYYLRLSRNEFGFKTVDEILMGRVPSRWSDACAAGNFTSTLSPIYLAMLVENESAFRNAARRRKIPIPLSVSLAGKANRELPENVRFSPMALFIEQEPVYIFHSDYKRHRPVLGGISLGCASATNDHGTLGGILKDKAAAKYVMTCDHVLPNAPAVVQQSLAHGGSSPSDDISNAVFSIPLQPGGQALGSAPNIVDVAVAAVDSNVSTNAQIRAFNVAPTAVLPFTSLNQGDHVSFVGKESDRVDAIVDGLFAHVGMKQPGGAMMYFKNVLQLASRVRLYFGTLSDSGDSGSWIVVDDGAYDKVCGMLIGGNGKKSACCAIDVSLSQVLSTHGIALSLA